MAQDIVDRLLSIDYVQIAIPFFLILVLLEVAWDGWRRLGYYRFGDALANMGCGAVQILTAIVTATVLIQVYDALYENHRLLTLAPASLGAKSGLALLLFLGVDLGYYWGHRFTHRVNLGWAGHGVHHQSEEYNLSVALRQSAFQVFFTWFFYLPLAYLGFSTRWYVSMASFVTMYQFWIHTRVIKTLGPFEWVLNTPSHHRVHHAINGSYVDKNYAGTLIIWDRMFGTFVPEGRPCMYGTVKPLKSFNPVWAQVAFFVDIVKGLGRHDRLSDKVRAVLAPPGWPDISPLSDEPQQTKYDPVLSKSLRVYVFLQFSLLLAAGLFLLDNKSDLQGPALYAALFMIVTGLLSTGFLLDGKKWAPSFEGARLLVTLLVILAVSFFV